MLPCYRSCQIGKMSLAQIVVFGACSPAMPDIFLYFAILSVCHSSLRLAAEGDFPIGKHRVCYSGRLPSCALPLMSDFPDQWMKWMGLEFPPSDRLFMLELFTITFLDRSLAWLKFDDLQRSAIVSIKCFDISLFIRNDSSLSYAVKSMNIRPNN